MVLNEPNSVFSFTFNHTCFFVFVLYSWVYTLVLLVLIHNPCCRLFHICVFTGQRKSHHSYSTVCPHPPSSLQCCLALSLAQDQTRVLYTKLESSMTSSWRVCGLCGWSSIFLYLCCSSLNTLNSEAVCVKSGVKMGARLRFLNCWHTIEFSPRCFDRPTYNFHLFPAEKQPLYLLFSPPLFFCLL